MALPSAEAADLEHVVRMVLEHVAVAYEHPSHPVCCCEELRLVLAAA